LERFGPVRSIRPTLVFEIEFDSIHKSARHKSGISLRFPRIKKWLKRAKAIEANSLGDLHALLD
jgi:DNA ligase-1